MYSLFFFFYYYPGTAYHLLFHNSAIALLPSVLSPFNHPTKVVNKNYKSVLPLHKALQ